VLDTPYARSVTDAVTARAPLGAAEPPLGGPGTNEGGALSVN
jgi:hypothetical protein